MKKLYLLGITLLAFLSMNAHESLSQKLDSGKYMKSFTHLLSASKVKGSFKTAYNKVNDALTKALFTAQSVKKNLYEKLVHETSSDFILYLFAPVQRLQRLIRKAHQNPHTLPQLLKVIQNMDAHILQSLSPTDLELLTSLLLLSIICDKLSPITFPKQFSSFDLLDLQDDNIIIDEFLLLKIFSCIIEQHPKAFAYTIHWGLRQENFTYFKNFINCIFNVLPSNFSWELDLKNQETNTILYSFFTHLLEQLPLSHHYTPQILSLLINSTYINGYFDCGPSIAVKEKTILTFIADNFSLFNGNFFKNSSIHAFLNENKRLEAFLSLLLSQPIDNKTSIAKIYHFLQRNSDIQYLSIPAKDLIISFLHTKQLLYTKETVTCSHLIQLILERTPHVTLATQNLANISPKTLSKLWEKWNQEEKQRFMELTEKLYKNYPLPFITSFLLFKLSKEIGKASNELSTSTQSHYFLYEKRIKSLHYIRAVKTEKEIHQFFSHLHQQETQETIQGRFTFVHGCRWQWDLLQDVYTALWQIVNKKHFNHYRFLRFDDNTYPLSGDALQRGKEIRESLLKNGRTEEWQRPLLLFMNHAIFGNSTNSGSCTSDYWYSNSDQSDLIDTTHQLEEICKQLNISKYYYRYQAEFNQLATLHKQCENRGLILLISVTPQFAEQTIFTNEGGGYKNNLSARLQGLGISDHVPTIIDTLKKTPEKLDHYADTLEYCLVLTKDMALNPDYAGNDIKMYPFHTAKPQEYKEYCTLRDELIAKIAADIEKDNAHA